MESWIPNFFPKSYSSLVSLIILCSNYPRSGQGKPLHLAPVSLWQVFKHSLSAITRCSRLIYAILPTPDFSSKAILRTYSVGWMLEGGAWRAKKRVQKRHRAQQFQMLLKGSGQGTPRSPPRSQVGALGKRCLHHELSVIEPSTLCWDQWGIHKLIGHHSKEIVV